MLSGWGSPPEMCPLGSIFLDFGVAACGNGARTTKSRAGSVEGCAAMDHTHLGPMGVCQIVHIDCAVGPFAPIASIFLHF